MQFHWRILVLPCWDLRVPSGLVRLWGGALQLAMAQSLLVRWRAGAGRCCGVRMLCGGDLTARARELVVLRKWCLLLCDGWHALLLQLRVLRVCCLLRTRLCELLDMMVLLLVLLAPLLLELFLHLLLRLLDLPLHLL